MASSDEKDTAGTLTTLTNREKSTSDRLPVTITKPIPYSYDLGNLVCNDANPFPPRPSNGEICSAARDCAQGLINQFLTTCSMKSSLTEGVLLTLPPTTTPLPREKPVPTEKEETKWEKFAKKKGIKDKKRSGGKMVYDEEKGEWIPKWGYKGRNKDGEGDWIVEVDEKKEKATEGKGDGSTLRGQGRRERVEKVRRNERKQRSNERRGRNSK